MNLLKFIATAAVALALSTAIADAGQPSAPSRSRKAEYIYLTGAAGLATQQASDFYMMLEHAQALDPSDVFLAGQLAEVSYQHIMSDSLLAAEATARLRQRFLADPADNHNADYYLGVLKVRRDYDAIIEANERLIASSSQSISPLFDLTQALVHRGEPGDFDRATAIMDSLSAVQPSNFRIAHGRATLALMAEDADGVDSVFENLYRAAPADADNIVRIISYYRQYSPNPGRSELFVDRLERADSSRWEIPYGRMLLAAQREDTVEFDRQLFLTLDNPTLDVDSKAELIRQYVSEFYRDPEQHERISRIFVHTLEQYPGNPVLHNLYGAFLYGIDEDAEAAVQFRFAVDLEPEEEVNWEYLFSALVAAEQPDDIISAAPLALERFPGNPLLISIYSGALSTDHPMEAVEIVKRHIPFVEDPSKKSRLFLAQGDLYAQMEMMDSALVAYDRAIDLDGGNSMAMNNAAYFMAVGGINLAKAELYASLACSDQPDYSTYLDTYAWVLFKRREYQRARKYIDKALQAMNNERMAAQNEAGIQMVTNLLIVSDDRFPDEDEVEAVEVEAEEEVRPHPETLAENYPSVEILDHAGDIYFMNGLPDEAIDYWKAALILAPDNEYIKRKVQNRTYFFE